MPVRVMFLLAQQSIVIIIAKFLRTNLDVRGMCKVQKCKDDNVQ